MAFPLGMPSELDWQQFKVDSESPWQHVVFLYSRPESRDWPRQRNHVAVSKPVDGWIVVIEYHCYDGYDPASDVPEALEAVNVMIEPDGSGLLPHRRGDRVSLNSELVLEVELTADEDGHEEQWGFLSSPMPVGERPDVPPSAKLLMSVTPELIMSGAKTLLSAARSDPFTDNCQGWYRLPGPLTSPTRRGRGGRSVREWAELAALYVYAVEMEPASPIKWLSREFAYTERPATWWQQIATELTKHGFLDDRHPGQPGGTLAERTIKELAAHRR